MSDVEPLIKRELQWMALGVLENRDLAELALYRVRRRRIKRAVKLVGAVFVAAFAVVGLVAAIHGTSALIGNKSGQVSQSSTDALSSMTLQSQIEGLTSDYPITWEQSVGDTGAISKAGGLGDTLGGLTAQGLKVSWEQCNGAQCPITWTLSVINNTGDIVSVNPALMIFVNHSPVVSASRPTTVTPGGSAVLVYNFPEFQSSLKPSAGASWQWNWFLTSLN